MGLLFANLVVNPTHNVSKESTEFGGMNSTIPKRFPQELLGTSDNALSDSQKRDSPRSSKTLCGP